MAIGSNGSYTGDNALKGPQSSSALGRLSRRTLVKSAVIFPFLNHAGPALAERADRCGLPSLFLYDQDVPPQFVRDYCPPGAETVPISAELDHLWPGLEKRLARVPMAMSGISTPAQFFCMQVLASGRRLHLVAQYPLGADDHATSHIHWLFRPTIHA